MNALLPRAHAYQTLSTYQWGSGALGDLPVPGDYDGDGVIDSAVWRRPTGEWRVLRSSTNYDPGAAQTFELGGGTPAVTSGVTIVAQPPWSPPVEAMWQATGVQVTAGDVLTITAPGTWTSGSAFTAAGDPTTVIEGTNCPLSGAPLLALVGRIGASGAPFLVGAQTTVTVTAAGELYLAPNDNWYALWDNSGALSVTVARVEGAALTEVPVPADYDGDGSWTRRYGGRRRASGRGSVGGCVRAADGDLRRERRRAAAGGGRDRRAGGSRRCGGRSTRAGRCGPRTRDSPAATQTLTWGAPAATCTPDVVVNGAPPASPPLTAMWQATGVTVTAGQTVSVTASGTWTSGTAFTADGDPTTVVDGTNCPLSGAHLMALVGRIGPAGAPFLIGQSRTFTAPASGEVYLAPNDNWYTLWDNSGSVSVAVCVSATSAACDQAVPADVDGDRRVDPTVWRPTSGTWAVLRSAAAVRPGRRVDVVVGRGRAGRCAGAGRLRR